MKWVAVSLCAAARDDDVRQLFRMLKPGTRVVSVKFGMGEWMPDKSPGTQSYLDNPTEEAQSGRVS